MGEVVVGVIAVADDEAENTEGLAGVEGAEVDGVELLRDGCIGDRPGLGLLQFPGESIERCRSGGGLLLLRDLQLERGNQGCVARFLNFVLLLQERVDLVRSEAGAGEVDAVLREVIGGGGIGADLLDGDGPDFPQRIVGQPAGRGVSLEHRRGDVGTVTLTQRL